MAGERSKRNTGQHPSSSTDDKRKKQREDVGEHIVHNLVPPGIHLEEAQDPGSKAPRKPVDNRS